MTNSPKKQTAYDNEYDNDAWSQKEISLSSKVLIALGGITSLGGVIPLIITKFSQLDNDFSVGPGFFLIFTIVYFTGPLLLLVIWSYYTNRIAKPKEKSSTWWNDFKRSPVTYRYKSLISLHIVFIIIYLSISIYNPWAYTLLPAASILLISPLIGLLTFADRVYSPRMIGKKLVIFLSASLVIVFFSITAVLYVNDIAENLDNQKPNNLSNTDYEKIAYVEETSARLDHLEKDLTNEADRFFILSGMNAWNILNQQMTNFEDSVDLSAFKIDQAISVFNNYLIDDTTVSIDSISDNYLLDNIYQTNGENKKGPKYLLPHNPFCKKHFNQNMAGIGTKALCADLGKYDNQLFIASAANNSILINVLKSRKKEEIESIKDRSSQAPNSFPKQKLDSIAMSLTKEIDFKMGMVNGHLDVMLEQDRHRLYPSCFSHLVIPALIKKKNNKGELVADGSLKKIHQKKLTATFLKNDGPPDTTVIVLFDAATQSEAGKLAAIKLSKEIQVELAATMNRYNSRVLKEWMEQMYLPYAQRKTGQEIQEIADETSWIWKEIKYMGIILSFVTLLLLSLQYIELLDLKKYITYTQLLVGGAEISSEEKEIGKAKVADLNQKANYLLFPLTTTITIVAILLIPVTTQTEIVNIAPTKSFRMLQVPSLKLPKAVESAVNIDYEEKRELDLKKLQENIDDLSKEIGELTKALNKPSSNSGGMTLEEFEASSQQKQTLELKKRISTLEEELKQKIAEVKTEIDKTKRR